MRLTILAVITMSAAAWAGPNIHITCTSDAGTFGAYDVAVFKTSAVTMMKGSFVTDGGTVTFELGTMPGGIKGSAQPKSDRAVVTYEKEGKPIWLAATRGGQQLTVEIKQVTYINTSPVKVSSPSERKGALILEVQPAKAVVTRKDGGTADAGSAPPAPQWFPTTLTFESCRYNGSQFLLDWSTAWRVD